ELDGLKGIAEGDQLRGEDTFAGADLEHHFLRLRLDGGDDLLDRAPVAEEVLPPLLLRLRHAAHDKRVWSAATQLPLSKRRLCRRTPKAAGGPRSFPVATRLSAAWPTSSKLTKRSSASAMKCREWSWGRRRSSTASSSPSSSAGTSCSKGCPDWPRRCSSRRWRRRSTPRLSASSSRPTCCR